MLHPELVDVLFRPDTPHQDAWVGEVTGTPSRTEYVPLRYLSYRYVITFTHPGEYFGLGDADVEEFAPGMFTKGIVPHSDSRLIKFHRAEADVTDAEGAYNPAKWRLGRPREVFQFGDYLLKAIAQHSVVVPQTVEYYYMATNTKLESLYGRIFGKRVVDDNLRLFEPILGSPGELYGYRKKADV